MPVRIDRVQGVKWRSVLIRVGMKKIMITTLMMEVKVEGVRWHGLWAWVMQEAGSGLWVYGQ